MPALPFTPPPHAATEWRRLTKFHTRRALRPAGRAGRCADAIERQLSRLPGAALWIAAWRSDLGIHWAFWMLFVAPLFMLSMATTVMSGWGLLAVDVVSVVWMSFSYLLVWRTGAGHTGWGATPTLYRVVMSVFLLPVVLMVAGVVISAWA